MNLEQHELSKAFPQMNDEEFQDLLNDIEVNGVLNPITIYEGKVLDGWHRYTASKLMNRSCPRVELDDSQVNPMDFVLSQNKIRRHLTKSQLAHSASQCYATWYGRPSKNEKNSANMAEFPENCVKASMNFEKRAAKDIAKMVGVGSRTVERARAVLRDGNQEVNDAVRDGKLSLEKAVAISKLPKDQQGEAINKPLSKNIHSISDEDLQPQMMEDANELDFQKLFEEQLEINNSLIKDEKDKEIVRLNELLRIERENNIGLQNKLKSIDQKSRMVSELFRKLSQFLRIDHPKDIWNFLSNPESVLNFYRGK